MNDRQLIKQATAFREGILGGQPSAGMCAAVSWPLAAYLRALCGIECETEEGENGTGNHVWIRLADGRVLDATADQYNYPGFKQYPPVYLGEPTELHAQGMAPREDSRSEAEGEACQPGPAKQDAPSPDALKARHTAGGE